MPDDSIAAYRVIFTRELDPITFAEPGTIVVSPTGVGETDDGFLIRVDVAIIPHAGFDPSAEFRMPAFLGFHDKSRRSGDL